MSLLLALTAAGGSGTTVSVPAGALTLTGYAPTVIAGGGQLIAVPLGTLLLTGYAPTVIAGSAPPEEPARPGSAWGRWYASIKGRNYFGSREEIEALLRQMAGDHAAEDERLEQLGEAPIKRKVRVVQPGRAQVKETPRAEKTAVSMPASVAELTGMTEAQAQAIYMAAYAAHSRRAVEEKEAAEIFEALDALNRFDAELLARAMNATAMAVRLGTISRMLKKKLSQ